MLPDLPTLAESGLPDNESTSWHGVFVPTHTPNAVVTLLHREVVAVLQQPDVKERLGSQSFDVVASTPEQFAAYIKERRISTTS